jgi:two-component system phosphate regulon response regulator PhoB
MLKRILIVDDRAEIRKLLAVILGLEYEIMNATDGEQALVVMRSFKPEVVFLDVMMPGKFDGIEVLRQIKSDVNMKQTLVAMVTAKGDAENMKLAQSHGADAFFVKPFSSLNLVSWLQEKL